MAKAKLPLALDHNRTVLEPPEGTVVGVQGSMFGVAEKVIVKKAAKEAPAKAEPVPAVTRKCSEHQRAKSIEARPLTWAELQEAAYDSVDLFTTDELPRDWYAQLRPSVRADCLAGGKNEQRPCPFVACRHHLAVEVRDDDDFSSGSLKIQFPLADDPTFPDFDAMPETCSLDVADRVAADGRNLELEELGQIRNCSIERIRQICAIGEQEVLIKIKRLTK